MAKEKVSVADIVVDRLIEKIQSEGRLPWQKPFQAPCMNWFSQREYTGINKILLDGGEYITVNQLKQYNEKNKTSFWFEKGTRYDIVVFYSKIDKRLTLGEVEAIKKKDPYWRYYLIPTSDGWVKRSWFLRYYRVYNIIHIKDKEGNTLKPHMGDTVIETHTEADAIVNNYISKLGVTVKHGAGGAYYQQNGDYVALPEKTNFASTEAYYRVLFHELIHSTGTDKRLNRSCFKAYHTGSKERSKEELVAEVGGLLLASEAGFRDDTTWADNSISYVAGWCSWMKDNKQEVINGMIASEKAKNYILSGGVFASGSSDRGIGEPQEKQEADNVGEIILSEGDKKDSLETPEPSESSKKSPDTSVVSEDKAVSRPEIKTIKSKKRAVEFYITYLSPFFTADLSEEEKKTLLDDVKAVELKHLYFLMTKDKLAQSKNKLSVMQMLQSYVDTLSRTGVGV